MQLLAQSPSALRNYWNLAFYLFGSWPGSSIVVNRFAAEPLNAAPEPAPPQNNNNFTADASGAGAHTTNVGANVRVDISGGDGIAAVPAPNTQLDSVGFPVMEKILNTITLKGKRPAKSLFPLERFALTEINWGGGDVLWDMCVARWRRVGPNGQG